MVATQPIGLVSSLRYWGKEKLPFSVNGIQVPLSVIDSFFSCINEENKKENCAAHRQRHDVTVTKNRSTNFTVLPRRCIKQRNRRVTFQTDKNDCLKTQVHKYEPAPRECLKDMHWTSDELAIMSRTNKEESVMYANEHNDIVTSSLFLFSVSGKRGCGEHRHWMEEEKAIRILSNSPDSRGLERHMIPLAAEQRRANIRHLVQLQTRLSPSLSPEHKQLALRKRSRLLSRQSANFALKIASGGLACV